MIALIVTIIITIFVSLKRFKRQAFTLTKNTAYTKRSSEDLAQSQRSSCEVVTKENAAYTSTHSLVAVASKNDTLYHAYQERPRHLKDLSNGNADSLNMDLKQNVAYYTTLNVAYKSQKSTNSTRSDTYEYVN